MSKPTCKDCRFWKAGPEGLLNEFGRCRRNPPPWNAASQDDWCGEHKPPLTPYGEPFIVFEESTPIDWDALMKKSKVHAGPIKRLPPMVVHSNPTRPGELEQLRADNARLREALWRTAMPPWPEDATFTLNQALAGSLSALKAIAHHRQHDLPSGGEQHGNYAHVVEQIAWLQKAIKILKATEKKSDD